MIKKLLPVVLLFLFAVQIVSAVIMDPSVDYMASDFTLNSQSSIDVDYINLSQHWIDLGSYGNITFASNFSSSKSLIEIGKGYLGGGANYTTDLSVDIYAPADWTASVSYDFTYLYIQNLSTGWTTGLNFSQYIWDNIPSIASSDTCENFCQQGGIYDVVDWIFRWPGLENWNKGAGGNSLHNLDTVNNQPTYNYSFSVTSDTVLRFVKPQTDTVITSYTQHNATHRRYTYVYNPVNTLDIDTTNYTDLTINATVTAYNDTLTYTGYRTFWNVAQLHEVGKPYGSEIVYADYNVTWNSINMTWNMGNNSDTTVIVRNNASWPTTPVDGYEVQNSTAIWYNESSVNSTRFYCLFGYNATTNSYSPRTLVYWGAVQLWNTYNESNPSQAINYSIEITNADASASFVANNIGNNYIIDLLDIPYGDDTVFTISNSSYKQRIYYYDLAVCNFYNYSFYLPPIVIPGGGGPGGGENITHQYWVQVTDNFGYSVQNAKVTLKRYINTTDEYTTVAILLTNSFGQGSVWLIPEAHYKIWIEKDGYRQDSPIPDWFPDPIFYGANYPEPFYLMIDPEDAVWPHIWDVISLTATKYDNGSMLIEFDDLDGNLIDIQLYTYEIYNTSKTLVATNTSTTSPRTFWLLGLNITRAHRIYIFLNHTTLITGYETASILVNPLRTPEYNKDNINTIVNLIIGPPPHGNWVDWMFVIIPSLVLLVVFGKPHPEIAIAFSSCWLGISSLFVAVPDQLVVFAPVGLVIAGIIQYSKHGGTKT